MLYEVYLFPQYDMKDGGTICLYMSSDMQTWDGAVQQCKNKGGQLASVGSLHEQNFFTSLSTSVPVWIGLKFDTVS